MSSLLFTLIQTNLFWEDKEANLQLLEDKINSITDNTHVIVLPEMFSRLFIVQQNGIIRIWNGGALLPTTALMAVFITA